MLVEIGHVLQYLLGSEPRRKEIENINNANTHAPNAWSSATLIRIDCDPLQQISHQAGNNKELSTRQPMDRGDDPVGDGCHERRRGDGENPGPDNAAGDAPLHRR